MSCTLQYRLPPMLAATGLGFSWKATRATSAMLVHTPLPMRFTPAYTALLSAMPADTGPHAHAHDALPNIRSTQTSAEVHMVPGPVHLILLLLLLHF